METMPQGYPLFAIHDGKAPGVYAVVGWRKVFGDNPDWVPILVALEYRAARAAGTAPTGKRWTFYADRDVALGAFWRVQHPDGEWPPMVPFSPMPPENPASGPLSA